MKSSKSFVRSLVLWCGMRVVSGRACGASWEPDRSDGLAKHVVLFEEDRVYEVVQDDLAE